MIAVPKSLHWAASVARLTTPSPWATSESSRAGPPDYSFDDVNDMPSTTVLSAQIAEW